MSFSSSSSSALRLKFVAAGLAAAALSFATSASATSFTDGNFTATSAAPGGVANNGEVGLYTNVAGWTSNAYTFVAAPGTLDTTGVKTQYGQLTLWGPGTGSANGLDATTPFSGNIIAADGAFDTGPLSQSISGLTVGYTYAVSFYYAGAQESGFTGTTTEGFDVSFGSATDDTPILTNASEGFTGWNAETYDFTATSATETLSFLAVGTPNGEPPFALLGGVTVSNGMAPTPEMGGLGLMFTGLMTSAGMVRYRMRRKA